MPYSLLVGQRQLKLALELAFIAPRIGGVLLSGQRGTGKSTVVRAFAKVAYDWLPVTLPINATEDRVVGGWDIDQLLRGRKIRQRGLLEEANEKLLYIDEVNLLDDHIVNIILDVTSTGRLVVEREGQDIPDKEVWFTLVGTMNPSEGGLRPQLLDRFGLMVDVVAEDDDTVRMQILRAVLDYDAALLLEREGRNGEPREKVQTARQQDLLLRAKLQQARDRFPTVDLSHAMAERCVRIGKHFKVEGHRGDYVLALAARASAALRGDSQVTVADLIDVAPLALQHRRLGSAQSRSLPWTKEDTKVVQDLVEH